MRKPKEGTRLEEQEMGQDGTDKSTLKQNPAHNGVAPDRAAQLARENQVAALPMSVSSLNLAWVASFDGIPAPIITNAGANAVRPRGQIDDCSKDKCVVNGKQYKNNTDIPGNHPKPLFHRDGKPVIDPEGKPVFGPDSADLEKITKDLAAHRNWFTTPTAVANFRHSGKWDFQRVENDDGRPIWTEKYQNYSNIAVGYILGSLGMNLKEMGFYANTYCGIKHCDYGEKRSPQFPNIADRQVKDFQIGLDLYKENHPDKK